MNALALKIIAVVTMVIDHVGIAFFPDEAIFRVIGRISFPLFAFLIAEGCIKTGNRWRYFGRLLAFGLISQGPYWYFSRMTGDISQEPLNIFFTLALGLLTLMVLDRFTSIPVKATVVLAAAALASMGIFSYGMYGLLLILASHAFLRDRIPGLALLVGFHVWYTIALLDQNLTLHDALQSQWLASLSLPLVILYDGSPGSRVSRWWFYWFYPAHLAALGILVAILGY